MSDQIENFRKIHNSGLIGFEELFRKIKELENQKSGFPPYDIIKYSDEDSVIRMAVAGYTKENISVELNAGKLIISGSINLDYNIDNIVNNVKIPEYVYKGIAERDFRREFTLADTVEVNDVSLSDGILLIKLKNIIPENKKYKVFEIR